MRIKNSKNNNSNSSNNNNKSGTCKIGAARPTARTNWEDRGSRTGYPGILQHRTHTGRLTEKRWRYGNSEKHKDTQRKKHGLMQTSQPSPKIRKAHEGREEQQGRTRRLKQEQLISEDTSEDTQTNRLPIRKEIMKKTHMALP